MDFVFPSLDLMPFLGGMLERSVINNIHFFLNAGLSIGHKPSPGGGGGTPTNFG